MSVDVGAEMTSILVVDDSTAMRQMVSLTLSRAGFAIDEAEDGVVALNMLKQNNTEYKLLITDVNMPNMDGISLVKETRQLVKYKFSPILVLTTESGDDKKLQGKEAGATGWIVKPFDPTQLVVVVNKVLGLH